MKKNIVLLLLDSMCVEDLKFIKKNLKHFPGFKFFLSKHSIEFSNAYGASTPTEHVMPTLFTGELPLNGKTYEHGIKFFRKDFFLTVKKNNYEFFLLSNHSVMDKMMGYSKNLIKIKTKNSIEHQWNYFQRVYCWSYLNINSYSKRRVKAFQKKYRQFLDLFENYILEDNSWFSKKVHNLNEVKAIRIKQRIKEKKKEIKKINEKNIEKILNQIISNDFFKFFGELSLKDKILRFISKFFIDKHTTWKASRANFFNYQLRFRNLSTNIDKLLEDSLDYINKKKQNFFLMAHINDLHHLNFSENNLILKKPKKIKFKHKHLYGEERELSLLFIDKKINEFLKKIPKEILNKLCVCLTSDHGTASDEKNEGPLTSKGLSGLFAERFLRTPLMIYQPGIKKNLTKKNDSLINSSNLFPILFKLANLKMNNYVKKLANVENQKYIFAEHTHRGPGYENVLNGQIYNCVITKEYKYIKKNKIGILDSNKTKEILVRKDNEEINLINKKDKNLLKILPLIKKIKARQKEILK